MKKLLILLFGIVYLFSDVYILNSEVNIKRYKNLHLDIYNYASNLKLLQKLLLNQGYKSKIISENGLSNLNNSDVLFIIDALAISEKAQKEIIKFVANGGRIVFNFKTAFIDEKGDLTKNQFLTKITGLKEYGYAIREKDHDYFTIQHLLSPISVSGARRLEMVVYDSIPILTGKIPDFEFTNWALTEPMKYKNHYIPSGIMWDGKYKKGGWIYFSFPFYIFANKDRLKDGWKEVVNSLINYVMSGISVVKYPYLKFDKMIFISEDTEYKFTNFANFINALHKYDINGTAFCVGRLAKLHPKLMKEAGKKVFLEIGSHSYSHTKLIDKSIKQLSDIEINGNNKLLKSLSNQDIKGFRPPREELNKKMIKVMETSSLNYILAKNLSQLKPKYLGKLMLFSRIGTDDYQYLMELDWNKTQIINKMKQEADYITSLNGLYTMSTHTHLMNYKTNVTMLEGLLKYIKKKHYPSLKGEEIARLIYEKDNIQLNYKKNNKGLDIKIYNKNNRNISEFIFRVYFLEKPFTKIISSLKTKLKIYNNYVDIYVFNLKAKQKDDLIVRY